MKKLSKPRFGMYTKWVSEVQDKERFLRSSKGIIPTIVLSNLEDSKNSLSESDNISEKEKEILQNLAVDKTGSEKWCKLFILNNFKLNLFYLSNPFLL